MIRSTIKTIMRREIEPSNLYGFVLNKNKERVIVLVEDDFWLDGYQILRTSDINSMKSTETNRHCTQIIKKEGLLKNVVIPPMKLDTWQDVFQYLKRIDEFVIVEDETEDSFLIGPIVRANKQSVSIRHFDGTGRWEKVYNMKYSDISSVRFDCRYIRYHRKYVEKD